MEYIFDQQCPLLDGSEITMGGAGKLHMYRNKNIICDVKFACKPFNELFWGLWVLFRNLDKSQSAEQNGQLGEQRRYSLR
jgi:hypothetical protein